MKTLISAPVFVQDLYVALCYVGMSLRLYFLFKDLRRKAARLVAAKCALAARVDASHECRQGTIGDTFREEIEKKLDKLQVCINRFCNVNCHTQVT
jgi:hypothetical protein